jgi:hypothetical protein
MPPVGLEHTISGERPQTYALDCAVTGIDFRVELRHLKLFCSELIAIIYSGMMQSRTSEVI